MLKSKACEWIYINLTFRKMIGVMLFLHVVVSKGLIEMEMPCKCFGKCYAYDHFQFLQNKKLHVDGPVLLNTVHFKLYRIFLFILRIVPLTIPSPS